MIPFGDEEDIAVFVKNEADGAFAGGVRQVVGIITPY